MPNRAQPHLVVAGVLTPDRDLELQPGFLVTPRWPVPADAAVASADTPAVRVESVDQSGSILQASPLAVNSICAPAASSDAGWIVSGHVPLVADVSRLRFVADETTVAELDVSHERSPARLTWPSGQAVDGIQTITWEPPERGEASRYAVLYSSNDGEDWTPISLPLDATSCTVDFDELPGGEACRVSVLASDGVISAPAVSEPFAVTPKGVRPVIVSPAPGDIVPTSGIILMGQAYHWEEQRFVSERLTWTSSSAGPLGDGEIVIASLPSGRQLITIVEKTSGASASVLVSVEIDPLDPPVGPIPV
jgi:hypothetical protein